MTNSNLKSQLVENESNFKLLKNKFEKTKKDMDEKILIIEDLKESVALKITVADDLQNLLKQSQSQLKEIKDENKVYQKQKE